MWDFMIFLRILLNLSPIAKVLLINTCGQNFLLIWSPFNGEYHSSHPCENFNTFWIPAIITPGRGRHFESDLFCQLLLQLRWKKIHMTSCYQEANGIVKRFHRSVKYPLYAFSDKSNCLSSLGPFKISYFCKKRNELLICEVVRYDSYDNVFLNHLK